MYTEARPIAAAPPRHLQAVARGARPSRVLLVDDDLFMLGVIEDLLRDFGVGDVTKALGLTSALAAFDAMAFAPELVMCDVDMPGGGGLHFMRELGAREFEGAVVLMSGTTVRSMHAAVLIARTFNLRIVGSLGKPLRASALGAILAELR